MGSKGDGSAAGQLGHEISFIVNGVLLVDLEGLGRARQWSA